MNHIYATHSVLTPNTSRTTPTRQRHTAEKALSVTINELINNLNFICLNEAIGIYNKLNGNLSANHITLSDEDNLSLLNIITRAYYLNGDTDTALLFANQFINLSKLNGNKLSISNAFRLASLLYYSKSDIENAIRMGYQSWVIATETGDRHEIALSGFTLYLGKDSTNLLSEMYPDVYESLYEYLVPVLHELEYYNYLSYTFSRAINLLYISRSKGFDSALSICNRGITLADTYKNYFRLSFAYHAQGLLCQNNGLIDKAILSYKKSESIKELYGSKLEKARIYNGLGYFYFTQEQYTEALNYYYKGLSFLERSKQYQEVCTTLINIGIVYFFSLDYAGCIYFLEKTLQIMNHLKISDLPFHPRFNIYSILAIAYIKENHISKALDLLNKINNQPSMNNPLHRLEYHNFLLAEINNFYNNTELASAEFEKAVEYLAPFENETKHIILYCYYEYGIMFFKKGLIKKSFDIFNRALSILSNPGSFTFHRNLFNSIINDGIIPNRPDLPFVEFDSEAILDHVKQDITLNNLHKKIQEINFLNSLQGIINSKQGVSEIIMDTGQLIHNSFLTSFCMISIYHDNTVHMTRPTAEFHHIEFCSRELDDVQKNYIYGTLLSQFAMEEQLITNATGQDTESPIGNIFSTAYLPLNFDGKLMGFILCIIQNKELFINTDDMRTLSIAANQIAYSIELKITTAKLLKTATLDGLTGVYNRQELHNRIDIERNRVFRYNKNLVNNFSVLFIDLDNFKFYNDTFGHQTGDFVLRYFVTLLEKSTRNVDVIGRFGGDEFIIMLPETTKDAAAIVAERILAFIEDQKSIREYIFTNLQIEIPEDVKGKIGCSIGISEYNPADNSSVDDILKAADKALYEAKRRGKNSFVIG